MVISRMKRTTIKYTSNPVLRVEIAETQSSGTITHNLAQAIMRIASGLGSKGNWRGYSYNDDMQGEAIVAMCRGVFSFNADKSDNPFGYLSMIAKNAFLSVLSREKRVASIRDEIAFSAGLPTSHAFEDRDAPPAPKLAMKRGRPKVAARTNAESES